MDAARPCFNEGEVLNGLGRGDAEFVDAIHTNNGALGQKLPIGDVDYFPNGLVTLQPGSLDVGSSHSRAYKLYAESVNPGGEESFMSTKCNSMYSYNRGLCDDPPVPMGYACPVNIKGNFFSKTNSKPPYGSAGITGCGTVKMDSSSDSSNDETPSGTTSTTTASPFAANETTTSASSSNETTTRGKFLGFF